MYLHRVCVYCIYCTIKQGLKRTRKTKHHGDFLYIQLMNLFLNKKRFVYAMFKMSVTHIYSRYCQQLDYIASDGGVIDK
jgi:hypothetical protein